MSHGRGPSARSTSSRRRTASRLPASQRPTISSVRPAVVRSPPSGYASAVSRNVTPLSAAWSRIAREPSSSTCRPNVIVPRQMRETWRPVRPRRTCCMLRDVAPTRHDDAQCGRRATSTNQSAKPRAGAASAETAPPSPPRATIASARSRARRIDVTIAVASRSWVSMSSCADRRRGCSACAAVVVVRRAAGGPRASDADLVDEQRQAPDRERDRDDPLVDRQPQPAQRPEQGRQRGRDVAERRRPADERARRDQHDRERGEAGPLARAPPMLRVMPPTSTTA